MADTAELSIFSFPTVTPDTIQTPPVDAPVDDAAVDDAVEETVDEQVEETVEEGDEIEVAVEESSAETKDDSKPLSIADLQKKLSELRKTNPDAAKILQQAKDNIGRYDAYAKLGKVDELRALKTTVDALGGTEKVAGLQEILTSVEATDAMLAEGNPEVVKQILADSPDGALKLAPHYLKEVYALANARARTGDTSGLDTLAAAIQPHAISMLKNAGFERVLNALYNATTPDEIATIYSSLKQWYDGETTKAAKGLTDTPDASPEMAKFQQEKAEFGKQQDAAFQSTVGSAIVAHTNKELGTRIAPYLKNHPNLSANQKADIANALYRGMDKEIRADKAGALQMKSFLSGKGRNQEKAIAHGIAAVSAHADQVVDDVMKAYGLTKGKKGAAAPGGNGKADVIPAGGKGTVANPLRVTEKPARDRWDIDATSEEMIIKGMCVLKNGRVVKWR